MKRPLAKLRPFGPLVSSGSPHVGAGLEGSVSDPGATVNLRVSFTDDVIYNPDKMVKFINDLESGFESSPKLRGVYDIQNYEPIELQADNEPIVFSGILVIADVDIVYRNDIDVIKQIVSQSLEFASINTSVKDIDMRR